jgi:phosphate-selective porin OprO/OprP
MKFCLSKSALLSLTIAATLPLSAHAADNAELEARIAQLEKIIQTMQQQHAEQDKQVEVMTKELVGVENQVSQAKIAKAEEKGSSKGSPVYAAFKDGVTFEDGTGNWKLAINGRVQVDHRQFSPDIDAADTFSLRRARLGGTLTFYKDYLARVEGEYSGGSTTLTYGYIDINKFNAAKLRLGQFKPNYGLERAMSTNFTDFQERSMGDALLGSTYDRGFMIFGTPTPGFNYSFAYVNGTGTTDENNAQTDGKDLTGRLTANFGELLSLKDTVVHIGGFYADGNQGSRRQANAVPTGTTDARGLSFFQTNCGTTASGAVIPGAAGTVAACGAALSNGFKSDVTRTRSGLETALAYGPVKLHSEYIKVRFDGEGFNRQIADWYASAVWNVSGETFSDMYKEGVFGRLKPKNNYKGGDTGWGALQIGVRYDQFDGSDFKKTGNAAGTGNLVNITNPLATAADGLLVATNEAESWTLGANWILNPNVRLVANVIRTNYDTPVTVRVNGKNDTVNHEDAITMRAQFDF